MNETEIIEEPKFARLLFAYPAGAWIWVVARVWLGYQWLHAGWEKVTGTGGGTFTWHVGYTHDSWLRTSAGLKGFAGFALQELDGDRLFLPVGPQHLDGARGIVDGSSCGVDGGDRSAADAGKKLVAGNRWQRLHGETA